MKGLSILTALLFLMGSPLWASCEKSNVVSSEQQMNEKQEIEAFIRERNKAMCDQDTLKLGRMMADDLMLVHMSGARQSKTSWLKDIADGTMRYYNIDMKKLEITVDGNHAVARMTSSIKARIWGSHGTWTLPSTMHLRKTEGGWLWTNE